VPYIVGFAKALQLAAEEREQRVAHMKPLRDQIIGRVLEEISDSKLTGHPENRLPNHASFVFKDVDGNLLLQLLDSAGFACSLALRVKQEILSQAKSSHPWAFPRMGFRFLTNYIGVDSTAEHVEAFLNTLPSLVEKTRHLIS